MNIIYHRETKGVVDLTMYIKVVNWPTVLYFTIAKMELSFVCAVRPLEQYSSVSI